MGMVMLFNATCLKILRYNAHDTDNLLTKKIALPASCYQLLRHGKK